MPPLSIVIPCLNEQHLIEAALARLQPLRARGVELICVDGGSTDGTPAIAEPLTDQLFNAPRGRASQMNRGAEAAGAELLLFLHADCRLPPAADRIIVREMQRSGRCWGRFDVRIAGRQPMLRVVSTLMNLRSRLTGIATGDQGIFVRRQVFQRAGGYPAIRLMEDIALSRALKAYGPPLCLRQRIETSGRRWESQGVFSTILLMWWLRLRYFWGADPERLATLYEGRPQRAPGSRFA